MRLFISIIVGLIGGFIIGIALSSFIAVIGMTLFDTPFGIKFLPYYTAFLCAILVPVFEYKKQSKS